MQALYDAARSQL